MENLAQRGVLLEEKCWRGYSSPCQDKEFFCKLSSSILKIGFSPNFTPLMEGFLLKKHWWTDGHTNWNIQKEILLNLFNINVLSIWNILSSAVPFSPFSHQSMVKSLSKMVLDKHLIGFWALRIVCHKFHSKTKAGVYDCECGMHSLI